MPADYPQWNSALVDRFYPLSAADLPAYLDVNEGSLEDIGGPNACDELARAVRGKYLKQGFFDMSVLSRDLEWRRYGHDKPPYVGLLGLCVLAASQMSASADLGIAATNYYARLNRLLGRQELGGRPPGFGVLRNLWQDLDAWLRSLRGERGLSTIATHSTFRHVGYPMSQAVFPLRDRRRLTSFFSSAGLEPGQAVSPEELLFHLRRWARPGCGLQPSTIARIGDAGWDSAIGELVAGEFRAWDGLIRDYEGRRRIAVVVNLFDEPGWRRCEVYLVARRPEGFPDSVRTRDVTLGSSVPGWYDPLPDGLLEAALAAGLTLPLEDGRASLSLERRTIIPLHLDDSGLGGWVSTSRIRQHEELVFLSREDRYDVLRRYLDSTGASGQLARPRGLPTGWVVIYGARVDTAMAGKALGDAELERMLPRLVSAIGLEGGLRLGRDEYLCGDGPDLTIDLEESAVVSLDGEGTRLQAGECRFPLNDLPPGDHEIRVDARTKRFVIGPQSGGADGRQAAGLAFSGDLTGGFRWRGLEPATCGEDLGPREVRLAGAGLDVGPAGGLIPRLLPILIRRRREAVVIGWEPGEIYRPDEPARPAWLDRVARTAGAQFYEIEPPFRPAFVVYPGAIRGEPGHVYALEAQASVPNGKTPTVGNRDEIDDWAFTIVEAATADVSGAGGPGSWEAFVASVAEQFIEFRP